MKTRLNMKKLAATAFTVLVISTGSFTQSNPGNDNLASVIRLETLMSMTEHAIRYMAPAVNESDDFFAAAERLEMLAAATEVSMKYTAPAVDQAEVVTPELERLEMLAAATEASIKYQAPEVVEISENTNAIINGTGIMLANNIK